MGAHPINMTGKRYASAVALRYVGENSSRGFIWLFLCDCGKEFESSGSEVRRGKIKACPACAKETKKNAVTTHGKSKSAEYAVWTAMKARCYNEKTLRFEDYGGRGIAVCERWRASFENFHADMGPRPKGMTVERENNNGNYEPNNCKWATRAEQSNNKRNNRKISIEGVSMNLVEWAKKYDLAESTIRKRLKSGISGAALVAKA